MLGVQTHGEYRDKKHTILAGDTCLYLFLKCKKILKLFLIFVVSFKFVFISACLNVWEMEKIKTSTNITYYCTQTWDFEVTQLGYEGVQVY
jgi:hypothetical protein